MALCGETHPKVIAARLVTAYLLMYPHLQEWDTAMAEINNGAVAWPRSPLGRLTLPLDDLGVGPMAVRPNHTVPRVLVEPETAAHVKIALWFPTAFTPDIVNSRQGDCMIPDLLQQAYWRMYDVVANLY